MNISLPTFPKGSSSGAMEHHGAPVSHCAGSTVPWCPLVRDVNVGEQIHPMNTIGYYKYIYHKPK